MAKKTTKRASAKASPKSKPKRARAKAAPANLTPAQMKARAKKLMAEAKKLEREAKALVTAAELAEQKAKAQRIRRRPAAKPISVEPAFQARPRQHRSGVNGHAIRL